MNSQVWYHMPLILAFLMQRQEYLCEFKANLVYNMSSRQPGLHSETLSQKGKKKKKVIRR
jgi:hypothetical protein